METITGLKTPLQIRLDPDELATLDTYIARFTDFPPSRVDVVRKAVNEWLAQKREPAPNVQTMQPATAAPVRLPALTAPGKKPLTPQQHAVMACIMARGNAPVTPKELATGLGLKQQAVAATVRFMVRDQILTVTQDRHYTLTAAYTQG